MQRSLMHLGMGKLGSQLPDDGALEKGVSEALGARPGNEVVVLGRRRNAYASTHPSEIVECRVGETSGEFLVKYGLPRVRGQSVGRGGVGYEVQVYQDVLRPLRLESPLLAGVYDDAERGGTWMVLEFVTGCRRLDDKPGAIVPAAAWLGKFHALLSSIGTSHNWEFLRKYDRGFYEHWAKGAAKRMALLHPKYPWLINVVEHFETWVEQLSQRAPTVIHGEFYPHNILARGDQVFPVDWESAARGFGEIDLVSLVDGWNDDVVHDCREAYKLARWGSEAPHDFEESLALADIYWNLRWLSGLGRNRDPFDPDQITGLPPRIKRLKAHYDRMNPEV